MTPPAETLPASPGDEKWLGGRKWTGLAAVIILGVLLVAAGGVVLFSGKGSGRQPQQTTPPTATAQPTPGGSQDQSLPTSAPPGVTWSLYQGVALPVSPNVGPTSVSGATASGFAHSPTGALIASIQLSARVFLAPDTEWQQAVEAMTVPGPPRKAWIAKRKSLPFGDGAAVAPGTYAQYTGFQFVGYSPELAVVELANGAPNRGYTGSTVTLVWRDGDWKLQLGQDGGTATNMHPVADLTGFTPWGGVS
jgi:hypothetical protein